MKPTPLLLVLALLAGPALAEDAPPSEVKLASIEELKDRYGFNVLRSPSREKCVRVDARLLKDLRKNYQCEAESTQSASGQPAVMCTRKDEKKKYAILRTRALCDEERETQAANGEE